MDLTGVPERPERRVRVISVPQKAEYRLGQHAIASLLAAYEDGATAAQLMATYGLGKSTVLRVLRSHGVQIRNQGLADTDLSSAVSLYEAGWSTKRIGERFGCDAETVRQRLKDQGVRIRSPWERVPGLS